MSETRHTDLKQMLVARRQELRLRLDAKLRDIRENNGFDGDNPGGLDAAETSDVDLQQGIAIALIEMKAEALRHVHDALVRLSLGSYGLCTECGAEISQHRLTALPFALRCRACEVSVRSVSNVPGKVRNDEPYPFLRLTRCLDTEVELVPSGLSEPTVTDWNPRSPVMASSPIEKMGETFDRYPPSAPIEDQDVSHDRRAR